MPHFLGEVRGTSGEPLQCRVDWMIKDSNNWVELAVEGEGEGEGDNWVVGR